MRPPTQKWDGWWHDLVQNADDLAGVRGAQAMSEHKAPERAKVQADPWPGRDRGERCPVMVQGVRCDYWSAWDELIYAPLESAARAERHRAHGGQL